MFLVASPFVITAEDPQRDIVDPAVEGTAAVLRAVAQHKDSVKRVVVTSSVCGEGGGRGAEATFVGRVQRLLCQWCDTDP